MMEVTEQSTPSAPNAPPTRLQLTKTPIAQLSPALEQPEKKCILATVSLIWPYSSSAKSLSLLLAEPDFRLRRPNGQVKAVFHGRVAESIAEQRVGIGDTVCLALKYSSFVPNDAAYQSPGRCIAWDLRFDNGVTLEVDRSSQNLPSVTVDLEPAPPHEAQPPCTPRLSIIEPDTAREPSRWSWGSPAFHRSSRKSSGSAVDSPFNPFVEEDGFVPGKGRKRPRYSLHQNEWRVVDEPEASVGHEEPMDWDELLEEAMRAESDTENSEDAESTQHVAVSDTAPEKSDTVNQVNLEDPFVDESSIFVKPSVDLARGAFGKHPMQQSDAGPNPGLFGNFINRPTDTPQLRPVPSPGLPIPSPMVYNESSSQGYFSRCHTTQPADNLQYPVPSQLESSAEQSDTSASHGPEEALHGLHRVTEQDGVVQDDESSSQSPTPPNFPTLPDSMSGPGFGHVEHTPTGNGNSCVSHTMVSEFRSIKLKTGLEISEESHTAVSTELMHAQLPNEAEVEAPEDQALDYEVEGEAAEDRVSKGEALEQDEIHTAAEIEAAEQASETSAVTSSLASSRRIQIDEKKSDYYEIEDTIDRRDSQAVIDVAAEEHASTQSDSETPDESENEDEVVNDEGMEADYISENEIDEEDAGDEDEMDTYESEGDNLDAQYSSTPEPEVIVLDSDSEEDSATEKPIASTLHQDRRQSVSSEESQSSAEIEGEPDEWSAVEINQEQDASEDQYSDVYESEDDYDAERPGQDDRVDESDIEDISSADDLSRDGNNEEHFPQAESVEEDLDDGEENDDSSQAAEDLANLNEVEVSQEQLISHEIAASPAEKPSSREQSEVQEQSAIYVQEHPSRDTFSALMGMDGAHNWSTTSKPAKKVQTPFDQHTEFIEQENGIPGVQEKAFQADFITRYDNGAVSLHTIASNPTEQQLPTPDLTQEVFSGDSHVYENEQNQEFVMTSEQESLAGLNISLPALGEEPTPEDVIAPGPRAGGSMHGEMSISQLAGNEQRDGDQDIRLNDADSVGDVLTTSGLIEEQTQNAEEIITETDRDSVVVVLPPDEPIHEEPTGGEQDTNAKNTDRIGVALPTAESIDELPEEVEHDGPAIETTEKAPETPIVVISKPSVPDREAHGLRSKISYYAPLASLTDHYNALVDTLSIVYEYSPVAKATSGPRDYYMSIFLTDPSMAGTTLEARIFRRYKSAMPSIAEGQAILLRDFKVQSHNHSMILVSVDASSWAVFDGSDSEAKVTGPPVEYGAEEGAFASGLCRWYSENGAGMVADSQLQASIARDSRSMTPSSAAASEAGSLDGTPSARGSRRGRRSHRRVTIHELRDGTRYAEVGSPSGQHGIHELRDGTVYANE